LVFAILASSCQVSETIYFNEDGSGKVEVVEPVMNTVTCRLANYSKEEKYSTHPTL
jgi:hypothetical protein